MSGDDLEPRGRVRAMSGSKKPIITIGATTEMSFVLSMSKLAPQTKVGFVCLGRRGGQWMADKAQEAGMTHIEAIVAGTNDPEKPAASLAGKRRRLWLGSGILTYYRQLHLIRPLRFRSSWRKAVRSCLIKLASIAHKGTYKKTSYPGFLIGAANRGLPPHKLYSFEARTKMSDNGDGDPDC